ncbi:dienelactone hydrolase family protein [Novosphingobium beihaiensis]|uniref:Dienelactone hydrolase family protein n=1 Tax=Novosphingobium beihaiensis TaxID=2930389 RepID=A0ABT0BS38_9SPHN|nr:dienelactone hydrolase family protein [Novosphingobium beihaiensis]MCJ2187841.1 dienelactone hydrolase family protein [Novosphingobium beihaiensis]
MEDFEPLLCMHRDIALKGILARPERDDVRGTVLMFPGATGPGPSFLKAMRELTGHGYLAIGIDMYGAGADISTPQAAGQHFAALMAAPELLRERAVAWFETVRGLPGTDPHRIAAIGYCFGGKCVLELARSGAAIACVTSCHGLLTTHAPARPHVVQAQIAVWSGARDPYAPAADLDALRAELDDAQACYQITLFSHAQHAFTDPDHDGFAEGIAYDPLAHRVAWAGTLALLAQTIG